MHLGCFTMQVSQGVGQGSQLLQLGAAHPHPQSAKDAWALIAIAANANKATNVFFIISSPFLLFLSF